MSDPTTVVPNPSVFTPTEYFLAIAIAIAISLVFALIEIPSRAKKPIGACMVWESLLYWVVLSFGNVVTTLLATLYVVNVPVGLAPYYFLLAAFFGVFGFETVLKNTNITMFDKGVLTIQTWIEKALSSAAAAAVDNHAKLRQLDKKDLVAKLMLLDEGELNTRILFNLGEKLGKNIVSVLDAEAKSNAADTKLYKVLNLVAILPPEEIAAFLIK